MKKTTLILLLLFISVFCLCGCELNENEENCEHPFIVYQHYRYLDIVYDKDTKVVYYHYDNYGDRVILKPYYLPDGSIAVYGKNFPYKGEE